MNLRLALIISCTLTAAILSPALAETPKLNVGGLAATPDTGSIKGVVKFEGEKREPAKVPADQLAADKSCVEAHKDKPLVKELFVFGDNNTLQNVVVFVSKGLDGKSFPAGDGKPVINQVGCTYVPHVQGMVKGQELSIKNSDPVLHNIHIWTAANRADIRDTKKRTTLDNIGTNSGVVEKKKFAKDGPLAFTCDVHPWMNSYVLVMDNPFFAVTQQDGTFEITGLPPGDYEISFWHEFPRFAPDKEQVSVHVDAGKTAEVAVTYAPNKK